MRAYVIRRVLLVIPTLFILSVLVFLSVRFLPGDAIDVMLDKAGWIGAVNVDRAALEHMLGLDRPAYVQYGRWIGVMVMLYPEIWWGWSPPIELIRFTDDPLGNLGMFLVPSFILGTALAASTMRMTRTMMLEVLRQDYVRTAWAKGLSERVVVVRHAMKNAFIPVVTLVGLQLPILVGGSVIMENIFVLPGLGRVLLTALTDRDYPVVMGVNLCFGAVVLGVNLLIDLAYPYLDPRVRYR